MITDKDIGKRYFFPISASMLYSSHLGKPYKLTRVYPIEWDRNEVSCELADEDGNGNSAYGSTIKQVAEYEGGPKYKVFVYHNEPFTITLPKGPLSRRFEAIKRLFTATSRIELVEGSTKNNIRVRFLSPRINREYAGWELVALNIGGEVGAVHEEKRPVRGAYPGRRAKATKAGRRDRAAGRRP